MTTANFQTALDFVWRSGFDDPADGYHITPWDPGGGTFGGVIETTWSTAVQRGLVTGALSAATRAQLATILRAMFWGGVCDALPSGIDLMMFNGLMMSGHYPKIFQSCLGFIGSAVDGNVGPRTIGVAQLTAPATFINALTGAHYLYLTTLPTWANAKDGWTARLLAAQATALSMIRPAVSV
jgi:lysozyme family protein